MILAIFHLFSKLLFLFELYRIKKNSIFFKVDCRLSLKNFIFVLGEFVCPLHLFYNSLEKKCFAIYDFF